MLLRKHDEICTMIREIETRPVSVSVKTRVLKLQDRARYFVWQAAVPNLWENPLHARASMVTAASSSCMMHDACHMFCAALR